MDYVKIKMPRARDGRVQTPESKKTAFWAGSAPRAKEGVSRNADLTVKLLPVGLLISEIDMCESGSWMLVLYNCIVCAQTRNVYLQL